MEPTSPKAYSPGVVGCYSLHLYCVMANEAHEFGEFPHQYSDEYGSQCRTAARKDGWIIKGIKAVCPKCSGKVKS